MPKATMNVGCAAAGVAKLAAASRRRIAEAGFLALAAMALVVAIGPASAQDAWLRDGKVMKDQPNAATFGSFGVMQIATNDPDRLIADWSKFAPGVSVKASTQTFRNRTITTFLVFKGCRAGASGNCNVTADFDVSDPEGKLCGQSKSVEIWVGRPPAPGNNLQLSSAGFGLSFDDNDPLGAYRVRATVTDHIAEITTHTEQFLTVLPR